MESGKWDAGSVHLYEREALPRGSPALDVER
jgi:hypothetical protein